MPRNSDPDTESSLAPFSIYFILLSLLALDAVFFVCVVLTTTSVHRPFAKKSLFQNVAASRTTLRKQLVDSLDLFNGSRATSGFAAEENVRRGILTRANYPLSAPFTKENPDICAGNVTVLIIVHTATDHFKHRFIIRQTYGNIHLFLHKFIIRTVFLLGLTSDNKTTRMIEKENAKHHDIVQGEFVDSYRNLTLKGVMAYRWITLHCQHAKLVVKTDDDVFLNIFTILDYYLPFLQRNPDIIYCNVVITPVIRKPCRWKVEPDEFRRRGAYPRYCSGITVLLPTKIIPSLYDAVQFTPFFWVDDVYLYGILPSKKNISYKSLEHNLTFIVKNCFEYLNGTNTDVVSCLCNNIDKCVTLWKLKMTTVPSYMVPFLNKSALSTL